MVLRARGSTNAADIAGKVRGPQGGRGNGNGKGGNGGGGGSAGDWSTTDKSSNVTINGNVLTFPSNNIIGNGRGNTAYASGVKYFEVTLSGNTVAQSRIGVATAAFNIDVGLGSDPGALSVGYQQDGKIFYGNNLITTVAGFASGDIVGILFNNLSVVFYKNGTQVHSQGTGAAAFKPAAGAVNTTAGGFATLNTRGSFSNLPGGATAWE